MKKHIFIALFVFVLQNISSIQATAIPSIETTLDVTTENPKEPIRFKKRYITANYPLSLKRSAAKNITLGILGLASTVLFTAGTCVVFSSEPIDYALGHCFGINAILALYAACQDIHHAHSERKDNTSFKSNNFPVNKKEKGTFPCFLIGTLKISTPILLGKLIISRCKNEIQTHEYIAIFVLGGAGILLAYSGCKDIFKTISTSKYRKK